MSDNEYIPEPDDFVSARINGRVEPGYVRRVFHDIQHADVRLDNGGKWLLKFSEITPIEDPIAIEED
jgi:hypothetical protein